MSPDGFVSHVPCRPIELSAYANEKRSSQEDLFGWKKGLEPSTFGTTIRRSNQLSYIHRVDTHSSYRDANVICFFGPCKIFGLKIFGKTHRVTKWQSPLLVCHAKPAKKRLAHLLMDTGVRKQLKKHI